MSLAPAPFAGTIRIEPLSAGASGDRPWDDSTLARWLHSVAGPGESAPERRGTIRVVGPNRLKRYLPSEQDHVVIRANVSQLLDDLNLAYDRLGAA